MENEFKKIGDETDESDDENQIIITDSDGDNKSDKKLTTLS